jgi:hypothetical protein
MDELLGHSCQVRLNYSGIMKAFRILARKMQLYRNGEALTLLRIKENEKNNFLEKKKHHKENRNSQS